MAIFYAWGVAQDAFAPVFDVPFAIEVLLTECYRKLLRCIEDLIIQSTLSEDEHKPIRKLNTPLQSEATISNGIVVLNGDDEFKVYFILDYRGHLSLWRI